MITEKEGFLLGIIRAKKLQARKFIDHNDHNSDYWRGQLDAMTEIERLISDPAAELRPTTRPQPKGTP